MRKALLFVFTVMATIAWAVSTPSRVNMESLKESHFSGDISSVMKRLTVGENGFTWMYPKSSMNMEIGNGNNTTVKEALLYHEPVTALAGEGECSVTCRFEGEEFPYFAIYRPGFFINTSLDEWFEKDDGQDDTFLFKIPAGTYDLFTAFDSREYDCHAYIVRENVEIYEDMIIDFNKDEATELLYVQPLLKSGAPVELPIGKFLEEDPWVDIDSTNANSDRFAYRWTMFKEGCNPVASYDGGIKEYCPEGWTLVDKILISKLSDSYHRLYFQGLRTMEGEIEFSMSDFSGTDKLTLDTYNQDYITYPFPDFVNTPVYDEFGCIENRTEVTGYVWIDNVQKMGLSIPSPEIQPKVYIANQPTDVVEVKTPIRPVSLQAELRIDVVDEEGELMYWYIYEGDMPGLPVWYNGEEWEYINQNHSECQNYSYQVPAEGPIIEYPGVEPYCFTASDIEQPLGNSAPILVLMTQYRNIGSDRMVSFRPQAWIGRYGEVRNCDNLTSEATVTDAAGNILFKTEDGELSEWIYEYFLTPHTPTNLKGTFLDTNILIDGEISGFNLTEISFDETNEDCSTPTPQMLIFKNTSGAITDRFKSASEGVIEFSAGDFNYYKNDERFGYTVEEADVLVEYAPYGEETWQPIEVEEVPEYFYMPGFGYFYRGSLGCVDQPSSNGWYDLRMTLTDKAGNRTVEHISPAFKIGEGSNVKTTPVDGINVWVTDGQIRTNCSDVASIEMFTLDGRLVAKTGGTAHASLSVDGLTGALLVRLTTASGSVTTHKLLL